MTLSCARVISAARWRASWAELHTQHTICDFFAHTSGICRSPYYSRNPTGGPVGAHMPPLA